jgi:small subunit ribosomal protein S16
MVRIRLARIGLKKQPVYRIMVIDQRKARNGKELEIIGQYNPRTRPSTDLVEEARALYWLSVGAQPSDAVKTIFERTGTWDRFQRLKGGEEIDTLVEEAETAKAQAEPVSPKTQYPAPGPGEGTGPRAQARAEAAAEVEAGGGSSDDDAADADDEATEEETE